MAVCQYRRPERASWGIGSLVGSADKGMSRFNVNLERPKAGWLPITISGRGDRIEIVASYTPRDSFSELVAAVYCVYRTGDEREVVFNEEPESRRLRLRKDEARLVVECTTGDEVERVTAGFEKGCREFARRFMLLLKEVDYDEFVAEWRHRPPRREVKEFWACFARR